LNLPCPGCAYYNAAKGAKGTKLAKDFLNTAISARQVNEERQDYN
jgi:hypothetical protein